MTYAVEVPWGLIPKLPGNRYQWIVNLLQAYHSLDWPFEPNSYATYTSANRWADAGMRALQQLGDKQS